MSPRKTTLAATILLLATAPAFAQNVPNPFLAPVQTPPPLQGTPPNGTPPMPDPIVETTPTIFTPYSLSPVVVAPQHQDLNVAPVTTFAFEPTPLLPPAQIQPTATPEATQPSTAVTEVPAAPTAQTTAPASDQPVATQPAETNSAEEPDSIETPAAAHPVTAAATTTSAAAAPTPAAATQNPNDVLILGITTGVKPTAMIRVGSSLGIYNTGDELPNGYTIESIEPLAVTFQLPQEPDEQPELELEDNEATSDNATEEDTPRPTTIRVRIQ